MKGCGKVLGCTDVSMEESVDNETIKSLKEGYIVMFLRIILCEELLKFIKRKEKEIKGICVGFMATFEYLDSNDRANSMTLYAIRGYDSVIKHGGSDDRKGEIVCLGSQIKIDTVPIVFNCQEVKQCKQGEIPLYDNLYCGYIHIYVGGNDKKCGVIGYIVCSNYHVRDWGQVILIAFLDDLDIQETILDDFPKTKDLAIVCFQDPATLKRYAIGVLIGQRTNKDGNLECVVLPFQGYYKDLADEYDACIRHILPSEYY